MREYLKKLRLSKKLSQREIASALEISQPYYSDIENGNRQIDMTLSFMNALSLIFGLSLDEIVSLENDYCFELKGRYKNVKDNNR